MLILECSGGQKLCKATEVMRCSLGRTLQHTPTAVQEDMCMSPSCQHCTSSSISSCSFHSFTQPDMPVLQRPAETWSQIPAAQTLEAAVRIMRSAAQQTQPHMCCEINARGCGPGKRGVVPSAGCETEGSPGYPSHHPAPYPLKAAVGVVLYATQPTGRICSPRHMPSCSTIKAISAIFTGLQLK